MEFSKEAECKLSTPNPSPLHTHTCTHAYTMYTHFSGGHVLVELTIEGLAWLLLALPLHFNLDQKKH